MAISERFRKGSDSVWGLFGGSDIDTFWPQEREILGQVLSGFGVRPDNVSAVLSVSADVHTKVQQIYARIMMGPPGVLNIKYTSSWA